jgi:hypothetical protein
VPLQNYFGWFFVVFIIFQSFAFYISKYDNYDTNQLKTFSRKSFWMEPSILYGIQGLLLVLYPFTLRTPLIFMAPWHSSQS